MSGSTARAVTVIGAGIVGLTAALTLADRGARVRIVAAEITAPDSAVAAALWAVPFVEQSERVREWAYRTLARLRGEASVADGIREQECRVVGTTPARPDPWTRGFTPPLRAAHAFELPAGYPHGTVSSIPLIDTGRYLPALRARCADRGITMEEAHVPDLADAAPRGELRVVAAGGGSGPLAGDAQLTALRSQIVRTTNPGLARTTIVRDGAAAPLTIVPRFTDVVIVGATVPGWDSRVDAGTTAELLERARAIEPALADSDVISTAVGHRPMRELVRVELDRTPAAPVIHCYGHGGAGVALSWGTAASVADLAEAV
jgi:D-amino-acid oxidase